MRIVLFLSCLTILTLHQAVVAQRTGMQFDGASFRKPFSFQDSQDDAISKSYRAGLAFSAIHTLVPMALGTILVISDNGDRASGWSAGRLLFGYGVLVGPSMGHFWLRNPGRGTTGLLIRSTGALLIASAAVAAALGALCEPNCSILDEFNGTCENDCPSDAEIMRGFYVLAIPSAALIVWSTIKGFLSLKDSARELHERNKLGLLLGYERQSRTIQIQLTYAF